MDTIAVQSRILYLSNGDLAQPVLEARPNVTVQGLNARDVRLGLSNAHIPRPPQEDHKNNRAKVESPNPTDT
jgi:hypothetical protein